MNVRNFALGNVMAALALAAGVAGCGDDMGSGPVDIAMAKDMTVLPPDMTAEPDLVGNTMDLAVKPCPTGDELLLTADITSNRTLQGGCTYTLVGDTNNKNYLFVKNNAVLTIEPGVTIKARANSVLIISRGSKIIADGTKDKPIVMTTDQADDKKTASYWGGLLVLGRAPINNSVSAMPPAKDIVFEAFAMGMEEGKFGGDDPMDNSGVLRYLRVEFGGFSYVMGREFNTITLAGVGAGTTIDYIQAHGGSDDGVELFGGTVNLKHVVSSQNGDDGFDTDNGWQGKAQFVIVQNTNPQGAAEASNGYESDNHATAFMDNPRTLPTMYNVTLVGKKDYNGGTQWAAVLRRGTGGKYYNHIFQNFQKGLEFRDAATKAQLDADNLFFKNSYFFGFDYPAAQAMGDIVEKDYIEKMGFNNTVGMDPMLEDPGNLTAPNFKPKANSPVLMGGATPPSDGFFDATATFVGAVGSVDWTQGWTRYLQPSM